MTKNSSTQNGENSLEEEQSLKYAKEFSTLYRMEKQKRLELEQANSKLKAYADELERKNADLQDFTFIASHDLREPLRKIISFADRLEEFAGNGDNQSKDLLQRIQRTGIRMQQLLDDLLQFSRVNTSTHPLEPIKLESVIAEVTDEMEEDIRESQGKIIVKPLPVLLGDRPQIKLLFANLIGNALKFHKPELPPVVTLNSRPTADGCWAVSVEDNGIGFSERYSKQIFKPFERLSHLKRYPGTGMGLTICKKIAARHAAEISAKSESGKGSTFTIIFPGIAKGAEDNPDS